MPKKKNKKYKEEYKEFINIPEDKKERILYIKKMLNFKEKDEKKLKEEIKKIKKKKQNKKILKMVFYIVPEGIGRPRRGRGNKFYIPNIQKFYDCMEDYLKIHKELSEFCIFTECKLDLKYYLKIPSDMKKIEKLLAELKYIVPIKKPDWDNLGKGSDMFKYIWLDDSLVSDGRVRKYYSFKPRIEVRIVYYSDFCNEYHKRNIEKLFKGVKSNGTTIL